jgi:glycosyltransferase involved in cell wall biosynthesis
VTPRVSVVIPAWNAAKFIAHTLDSVKSQSFNDYEVIVTDDGSKDATKDVVDAWLRENSVAGLCIRQENKKIAAARNTAMQAAKGQFLAFLDHDDFWYPEKLSKSVAAFDAHPDAVLVGSHIEAKKDGVLVSLLKKGPAVPGMYERLLFEGNSVAPSAAVVRREAALTIGGFREDPRLNTVEDYDFWMRLSRTGPFVYLDEALASYTIVENSASSKVEYHHSNLEYLLRLHFAEHYPNPTPAQSRRMRRRLSMVYRSAAGALLAAGQDRAKQKEYIGRMLREYPLDWKNLGRAAQYLIG